MKHGRSRTRRRWMLLVVFGVAICKIDDALAQSAVTISPGIEDTFGDAPLRRRDIQGHVGINLAPTDIAPPNLIYPRTGTSPLLSQPNTNTCGGRPPFCCHLSEALRRTIIACNQ